jgi:hypothetical protein
MDSNPNVTANRENPFAYFKPADEMLPVIQATREAYATVHRHLLSLPASRERSVAITELETSAMWAIKGLVINDEGSTRPETSGVTGS